MKKRALCPLCLLLGGLSVWAVDWVSVSSDAWRAIEAAQVASAGTGVEIAYAGDGKSIAQAEAAVDIPSDWRGRRVTVAFDLENAGDAPFGNGLNVLQFDAQGKVLAEEVVDPRFITQMRPARNRHVVRCDGSVHPHAVRAVVRARLRGLPAGVAPSPHALRIHSVTMCPAAPRETNPAFFTTGVDGEALDLHEGRALAFPVYSRVCWGQGQTVTETKELFYPSAAGTVEAWLKCENGGAESYRVFETANLAPGAANAHLSRGALMSVDWQPKKGTISLALKGTDGKTFSTTGTARLDDGAWHHLAVTFEPGGEAAIFIDGGRLAASSLAGWKAPRTGVAQEGAMMFFLGGGAASVRRSGEDPAVRGHLPGAVDNLRISSSVRYRGDFSPVKTVALDDDTRAFFAFSREIDGVSAGGGGLVESAICAREGLDRQGAGATFRDPPPFDVLNYKQLPSVADFMSLRRHQRKSFNLKVGERASLALGADIVPDFTEIANTGSAPLVAPLVLAPGEVDPRSFETMARTLKLDGLSDRAKVDRIFQYLIHATDYFIQHPAVVPPGGNHGESQGNHPLKLLNGYCSCACGGLNNLAACSFVQAGHVPADRMKGYGHEFESCLLDGKTRLYDLSGQQFFRSFTDGEPASLQDVDREFGLHARYGKNPDHFSRLSSRSPMMASPYFATTFFLTLSPGERFRWWRRNDGVLNDVWYGKTKPKFSHPLVTAVPKDCTIKNAFLVNRMAPDLANGELAFDGVPDTAWPAFAGSDADHLVYTVEARYTATRGAYRAELADGDAAKLEWSIDGKAWSPLVQTDDGTAETTYAIRGRSLFYVRAVAKPSDVKRFSAWTEIQMNPRVLTGLARPGANELQLIAEGTGSARVTVGWAENAAPIEIAPVGYWGTVRGAERMLATVDPTVGTTRLAVKGVETVKSLDARLTATLAGNELVLSSVAATPYLAVVRLGGASGEKALSVLVGNGARLVFANPAAPMTGVTLRKTGETAELKLPKLDGAKYFVFNLERTVGALSGTDTHRRTFCMLNAKGRKARDRKLECGGCAGAADFYKAGYGVKGGRGNIRWDSAVDPSTRYPLGSPRLFAGTDLPDLSFAMNGDVPDGFEFFAALVAPEGDFAFRAALFKLLYGLNYDPDLKTRER